MTTVFYPFFLLYVFGGIAACAIVFYWAVANGQFQEQDRARYLPLSGEAPGPCTPSTSKWPRSMVLTVLLIASALLLQIASVLVMLVAR